MKANPSIPTMKQPLSLFWPIVSLALVILGLVASLFFQKVNAEFFALSGLAVIAAVVGAAWTGQLPRLDRRSLPLLLMFLFWGWIGIATIFSPATFISIGTFLTIGFLPLVALTVLFTANHGKSQEFIKYALFFIIGTLAIYACVKFFIFNSPPRATFANKNNFAALQIPMAFFAGVAAIKARRLPLQILYLGLVALFVFTIGIIGSRGVLICLTVGFLLIFALLLKDRWPRRSTLALFVTVFVALWASNLAGSGSLLERTETMLTPSSADSGRFEIWQGSLELAKDTPWHGVGPGLFPIAYPPYRLDEDKSAAFFVHNDYLQLFIEAGWPAPALLILSLMLTAISGLRKLYGSKGSPTQRLYLLPPLLGYGAIAAHSLLSFNLFLPSLLIMMGVLLGLITHALKSFEPKSSASEPGQIPGLFSLLVTGLALMPTLYFIDTGRSSLLQKQATSLSENQQFQPAIKKLERAIEISPGADLYHYSLAWLWHQQAMSGDEQISTTKLAEILDHLDTGEELNPLRPQVPVIRARVLQAFGSELNTEEEQSLLSRIEKEYGKALELDPFNLEARFYFARFLLKQNRLEEGQKILEEGIEKPYQFNPLSVNYYRLTAEIRRIMGDPDGYQNLMSRLREAIEKRQEQKAAKSQAATPAD